jgi:hypothetical protein
MHHRRIRILGIDQTNRLKHTMNYLHSIHHQLPSCFLQHHPPQGIYAFAFFNSASISPLKSSGFFVLAQRPLTLPSLPTKNFSKFHFTRFIPNNPAFSFLSHSNAGSALSPFTSILPNTGNETP